MVLSLAILSQSGFGQIPTLDKPNLDNNQSPQCLDFNQDKICEFIVLTNGTMIENPDRAEQVTQSKGQSVSSEPVSVQGTCLGFQTSPEFCRFLMMPNGEAVPNENWTHGAFSVSDNTNGYTAPAVRVLEETDNDDSDDDNNDNDKSGNNDNGGGDEANPYCDLLDDVDKEDRPESCHDRDDFDEEVERTTGKTLYPCNDGSNRNDPRDCPDVSGFDYSNDNDSNNDNDSREDEEEEDTGGSNPEGEEEDQSCGGESCTDDEKDRGRVRGRGT
jgi:hypothetical protein